MLPETVLYGLNAGAAVIDEFLLLVSTFQYIICTAEA